MADKSWRKRTLGKRKLKPETLMMGYGYDPQLSEGSLKPPQFQTSTFVFKSAEDGKKFFAAIQGRRKLGPDEEPGLVYSRFNNPNLEVEHRTNNARAGRSPRAEQVTGPPRPANRAMKSSGAKITWVVPSR